MEIAIDLQYNGQSQHRGRCHLATSGCIDTIKTAQWHQLPFSPARQKYYGPARQPRQSLLCRDARTQGIEFLKTFGIRQ
jgi:hypothetical protein